MKKFIMIALSLGLFLGVDNSFIKADHHHHLRRTKSESDLLKMHRENKDVDFVVERIQQQPIATTQNQLVQASKLAGLLSLMSKLFKAEPDQAEYATQMGKLRKEINDIFDRVQKGELDVFSAFWKAEKSAVGILGLFLKSKKAKVNCVIVALLTVAYGLDKICNNGLISAALLKRVSNIARNFLRSVDSIRLNMVKAVKKLVDKDTYHNAIKDISFHFKTSGLAKDDKEAEKMAKEVIDAAILEVVVSSAIEE